MSFETKLVGISLIFLLCGLSLRAQVANYNTEKELWYDGMVQTSSGEKLTGRLNYNFVTDRVQLKTSQEAYTFYPGNVVQFQYYTDENEIKVFYSLEYKDKKQQTNSAFFNLLYENGTLALLARHVFIYKEYESGGTHPNYPTPIYTTKVEKVERHIYFGTKQGLVVPYLKKKINSYVKVEWDSPNSFYLFPALKKDFDYDDKFRSYSSTKNYVEKYNYQDKSALKKLTGSRYAHLKLFMQEHQLNPNKLSELIKILDYHESLK